MLVRVGNSKDVAAGKMRAFEVEGIPVNAVNVDGHLHALEDTCTHSGCSLAKGMLCATVTCTCHGSQFDVTSGAVLRGPARRAERSRLVQVHGEDLLVET
jgi:nitrite reductase/ring-hydroxylating ferredoxin subunit